MSDLSSLSDAELTALYQQQKSQSLGNMSDDDLKALYQSRTNKPQGVGGSVIDIVKSAPRALLGGLAETLANTGAGEAAMTMTPEQLQGMPNKAQVMDALEKNVTGDLYKPQTTAGRISTAGLEQLTNPVTYVGPGTAALKVGGGLLSGAASEAAGEATQGTKFETPARLAGALAGGVAAAKTLGPTTAKAAIPTVEELKDAASKGYTAARESGIELNPAKVGDVASGIEQELTNGPKYAFTGGKNGTAPQTFAVLQDLKSGRGAEPNIGMANALSEAFGENPQYFAKLQSAEDGARRSVTGGNLDALRIRLNNIAGETRDFKPTPDAKAAMVAKQRLNDYLENIPQDHVVAGDAEAYVRATKQANADSAAASRAGKVEQKLTNAENNAQGGIATSVENQQKSQLRNAFLNNPKQGRGFSADELAQIQRVNDGSHISNVFRQLGRGGTGVIPMMAHAITALGTGGASIPAQLAVGVPLYASKKISEALTNRQANKLVEMLRMRSPEYRSRVAATPVTDNSPNKAAIVRALLAAH